MTRKSGIHLATMTTRGFAKRLSRLIGTKAGCDESGSTLVETALSLSVLLMTLLGIAQISIALYANDFLSQAARDGARWAIVRGGQCSLNTPGLDHCNATQSDIQTHVQGLGYPFANAVTVNVSWLVESITLSSTSVPTASWASTCTSSSTVVCPNGTSSTKLGGDQVQVTVSYSFPVNIPFWKNGTVPMASTSTMVISQ
jgi:hypothetical protein